MIEMSDGSSMGQDCKREEYHQHTGLGHSIAIMLLILRVSIEQ